MRGSIKTGIKMYISLFGATTVWMAEMLTSEPAVAMVCSKKSMYGLLPAIGAVCVCAAIAAAYVAYRFWRETRNTAAGGRRFIGFVGILSSGLFMIVTLFTTCSILLVSPCYHVH